MTAGAPDQFGPAGTGTVTAPLPQVVREPRGWPRVGQYKQAIFIVLLVALCVLFIYPFIWLISASFKPNDEVFDNRLIPHTWDFSNYVGTEPFSKEIGANGEPDLDNQGVFDRAPVLRWLINSTWIALLGAVAVALSSALVAFAFAYFRFPGRNALFALILGTMMLPGAVTMIPVYLIWNEIGQFTQSHAWMPHIGVNTQYPLWVPNLFGSAFYIFLLRQFFLGIPRDLFEAARIDGDNYLTMFWRIAMPLAKPALIVVLIFEIQAKWFDLMTPLIYLRDAALFTLPLGLKTLLDQFGQGGGGEGEWNIILAGTVVLALPMIIIFAIFQRYFLEGIATQGRKG
jgi:multiple sugar transport system permease protein